MLISKKEYEENLDQISYLKRFERAFLFIISVCGETKYR
jgi:hypothetical protein